MTWYWQAVATLASGGLVAWISTRLALSRFYSERLWERKLRAYEEIISSLYDEMVEFEVIQSQIDGFARPRRSGRRASTEEHDPLRRYIALGGFLIPREISNVLSGHVNRVQQQGRRDDPYDEIEDSASSSETTLNQVRFLALKDLNTNPNRSFGGWLPRRLQLP